LELLNYCPDGQNGDFQYYILTATFYFVMLNNLYYILLYSLGLLVTDDEGMTKANYLWPLCFLILKLLWNKKSWLENFMFLVLKKVNI